jgi:hypothetical protein
MLRALLALALLANLVFFAWAQGWLPGWPAPQQGEREPSRVLAQMRPEAIAVLPPKAASGASGSGSPGGTLRPGEPACLEAGPFSDADIGAAEAALQQAGLPAGSWTREQVQIGPSWVVFAGRPVDAAARAAREKELRAAKLAFELAEAPPELAGGFVLSRHASRDGAELALASLGDKAVGELRVVAVPPPPLQHWLRAGEANADLQARLAALSPGGSGFRPCVQR